MRGRRALRSRDRGSVSIWVVIFTFTVIVLLGLVVDGGQVMIAKSRAADIAEQAARATEKRVELVPTDSIPAGIAAMVVFDGARPAAANAAAMRDAIASVATGEVTIASRDAVLDGLAIRKGNYFGLASGDPVAEGRDFEEVAHAVVERLLAEPREVLTLLRGADAPELGPLVAELAKRHPELEVDVQDGGQPHYPLLVSAE